MFNLFKLLRTLARWMQDQDQILRIINTKLLGISLKLDTLINSENRLMTATEDLKQKLAALDDEADNIAAGIKAIKDAQAAGNSAAVDAAVAELDASVNTVKEHLDAAKDALDAGGATPAPVDPNA